MRPEERCSGYRERSTEGLEHGSRAVPEVAARAPAHDRRGSHECDFAAGHRRGSCDCPLPGGGQANGQRQVVNDRRRRPWRHCLRAGWREPRQSEMHQSDLLQSVDAAQGQLCDRSSARGCRRARHGVDHASGEGPLLPGDARPPSPVLLLGRQGQAWIDQGPGHQLVRWRLACGEGQHDDNSG